MSHYYRKINEIEFDHVFSILSGGTITDGPDGIHAPNSYDGYLDGHGWEYVDGYSGQYGYRGPIMHPSEYIGGSMERDLLSTPGIYAVVSDEHITDESDVPDDFPVRPIPWTANPGPGIAECGECHLMWDDTVSTSYTPVPSGRCPFESFHSDEANGWAVVRYVGALPTRGRYIGTWHGGASYSGGEWTDAEWFGSLADARDAIRDRMRGHYFPPRFRYVVRADVSTDTTPCAHDEWSGGITLWKVTDRFGRPVPGPVTPDDVERIVTSEYPDRIAEFGPRGGIVFRLT